MKNPSENQQRRKYNKWSFRWEWTRHPALVICFLLGQEAGSTGSSHTKSAPSSAVMRHSTLQPSDVPKQDGPFTTKHLVLLSGSGPEDKGQTERPQLQDWLPSLEKCQCPLTWGRETVFEARVLLRINQLELTSFLHCMPGKCSRCSFVAQVFVWELAACKDFEAHSPNCDYLLKHRFKWINT